MSPPGADLTVFSCSCVRSAKRELRGSVSNYLNGVNQVDVLVAQFRYNVKQSVLKPLHTMLVAHQELQVAPCTLAHAAVNHQLTTSCLHPVETAHRATPQHTGAEQGANVRWDPHNTLTRWWRGNDA